MRRGRHRVGACRIIWRAIWIVRSARHARAGGPGNSSTAVFATLRVAELLKTGQLTDVVAFATSKATAEEALRLGIPMLPDNLPEDLRGVHFPGGLWIEAGTLPRPTCSAYRVTSHKLTT
jgi:hypothetical protein